MSVIPYVLCQCACWFMSMCTSQVLTWARKGVLALMGLELQMIVSPLLWVLRSEIHTTEKAVSILNFWAISLALSNILQSWFKKYYADQHFGLLKKSCFFKISVKKCRHMCITAHMRLEDTIVCWSSSSHLFKAALCCLLSCTTCVHKHPRILLSLPPLLA